MRLLDAANLRSFAIPYDSSRARVILAEDEGSWITVNGVHIHLDKEGTIDKGPKQFIGKKPHEMNSPDAKQTVTRHGDVLTKVDTKDGVRVMPDGSPLPKHIKSLAIPPAWTDVHVNPDKKGTLWATGKDAKRRLQSKYNPKYSESQSAKKFARVLALEKKFDKVSAKNEKGMTSKDPATRDAAHALALIFHTGIRPGSDKDTGAEKQAYGATTLLGKHVVPDGDGVRLQFVGKKGVDLDLPVTDKRIASDLLSRAKASGGEGKLFPNTDASHLLQYTHSIGGQVKTKDFRTLLANQVARTEIQKMPAPTTAKGYKAAVKDVATYVSQKLGNTPAVALKSYINPEAFSGWKGAMA